MNLRRWLACLVVAGLFFLPACTSGDAPTPEVRTPTTSPSAIPSTPSPTVDWFPATATPTLAPTPVRTPTPELRSDLGEVLLRDDFTDGSGWQVGKSVNGTMAYGQAGLTLAIAMAKGSLTSLKPDAELADGYLEVSIDPSLCRGDDSYGLLLRAGEKAGYRLVVTCGGRLRFERWQNDGLAVLQDWTPRLGTPAPTRLGVWMRGPEFRIFINDMYQFSVTDKALTQGTLGVFARAAGNSAVTVSFSELVVRGLTEQTVQPAATAIPSTVPAQP